MIVGTGGVTEPIRASRRDLAVKRSVFAIGDRVDRTVPGVAYVFNVNDVTRWRPVPAYRHVAANNGIV